jgi:clan AA aspartic protease (TIGR02281 family)
MKFILCLLLVLFSVQPALNAEEIPLESEHGTLTVHGTVNDDLEMEFTLDTGAAHVSIPESLILKMARHGKLKAKDVNGANVYILGDGRRVINATVLLKSIRVGGIEIRNVTASVGEEKSSPLLGQSFLKRLGSYTIDSDRNLLIASTPDSEKALNSIAQDETESEPEPVVSSFNPQAQQMAMWRQVSFPLDNFTRFSTRFGWIGRGKSRYFNDGLDMPAPKGSYLRAWADGQVVNVSYNKRCGNHVIIISGDWKSTYCHLSAMNVKVGDYVEAGQVVAAVGSTGRSTRPHLHWTLRYYGQLVDPELVIRAMQAAWKEQ